jgi:hypothetical protein
MAVDNDPFSSFAPLAPPGSDVLEPHLVHDERVLWVGRPDASRYLTKSDVFAVPFSLMWGAFAIFWEISAIASGAPFFFYLWGVPFVAIGLYMIVGRFFYRTRVKRRTWYAVTNRRVLKIERRSSGDAVEAMFLDAVPSLNREVRSDGSGTIVFGNAPRWQAAIGNSGLPGFFQGNAQPPFAFYDIPDAAHVAELVTQLRQARPER